MLQAAAAVGQMGLVQAYESRFQKYDMHTAQVLLTHDDLSSRERYLNARSTLRTLLGYGVVPVINDPDSTVSVIASLIPFFTPLLMMLRIAIKMPPFWQVALGYLLTTGFTLFMIWLSARVYRTGILMYGKKPTLKELWRWVRYA